MAEQTIKARFFWKKKKKKKKKKKGEK